MKTLVFLTILVVFLCACEKTSDPWVLFDFESEKDLDRMHWKCFTLPAIASRHATHGEKALRIELFPSDYPGWYPKLDVRDWRGYRALRIDVFNPGSETFSITVRIDDRKKNPGYPDRHQAVFDLTPGANPIEIDLTRLQTSGTRRPIELESIHRFMIYTVSPREKKILYLDWIRLLRG
jgi:hypothetical protein